jgi:hypothetical protein
VTQDIQYTENKFFLKRKINFNDGIKRYGNWERRDFRWVPSSEKRQKGGGTRGGKQGTLSHVSRG